MPNCSRYFPAPNWRYLLCPFSLGREVTVLIKKIKKVLFLLRLPVNAKRREFNGELLDQHREDAYALLHQQMTGLR